MIFDAKAPLSILLIFNDLSIFFTKKAERINSVRLFNLLKINDLE